MPIYYVYWIRYSHHTDPLNEGYVGVSTKPENRFKYHSSEKYNNNPILFRAIKKGAQQEILYSFEDKNQAYTEEASMRPNPRIGWNIIPGGDSKPPVGTGRKQILSGPQPKVSCCHCRAVVSFHRLATHKCLEQCSLDNCTNYVKKHKAKYCSHSCSAKARQQHKFLTEKLSCPHCDQRMNAGNMTQHFRAKHNQLLSP